MAFEDECPPERAIPELFVAEWHANAEARAQTLAIYTANMQFFARAYHVAYTALCAAGFDAPQAMELLCARGWQLND